MGRCLGLDIGRARIGVSMSDPLGLIASPSDTYRRSKGAAEAAILRLIEEHSITTVVAGLALDEHGEETESSRDARGFCRRLARRAKVEIVFVDEYGSSIEAQDRLNSASGRKASLEKGVVDRCAASIVLQTYLDRERA